MGIQSAHAPLVRTDESPYWPRPRSGEELEGLELALAAVRTGRFLRQIAEFHVPRALRIALCGVHGPRVDVAANLALPSPLLGLWLIGHGRIVPRQRGALNGWYGAVASSIQLLSTRILTPALGQPYTPAEWAGLSEEGQNAAARAEAEDAPRSQRAPCR